MFPSETLSRILHADRVRELERAAEVRRQLAPTLDESAPHPRAASVRAVASPCPPAKRGDSAGVAA
jgi:hypothetical protein